MTLKDDVLKALGFTYTNPDISPICYVETRDAVITVIEEHTDNDKAFCKWLDLKLSGWAFLELKAELMKKKKSLGLGA